jgi:hypothetical protein
VILSNLFPFILSSSKDSERVFHQPVGVVKLMRLSPTVVKGAEKSVPIYRQLPNCRRPLSLTARRPKILQLRSEKGPRRLMLVGFD